MSLPHVFRAQAAMCLALIFAFALAENVSARYSFEIQADPPSPELGAPTAADIRLSRASGTLAMRPVSEVVDPNFAPVLDIAHGFVNAIGAEVGELELAAGEAVRTIKVRIRRAATRLGTDLQIWDSDGKVYFSRTQHRGRPRKATPTWCAFSSKRARRLMRDQPS